MSTRRSRLLRLALIVRLPVKTEVPYRMLREAAQLAAFYSEARGNALVDVRYTERSPKSRTLLDP